MQALFLVFRNLKIGLWERKGGRKTALRGRSMQDGVTSLQPRAWETVPGGVITALSVTEKPNSPETESRFYLNKFVSVLNPFEGMRRLTAEIRGQDVTFNRSIDSSSTGMRQKRRWVSLRDPQVSTEHYVPTGSSSLS